MDSANDNSNESIIQRGRGRGSRGRGTIISSGIPNVSATGRGRGRGRGTGRGTGRGPVIADDFFQATSSNLPLVSYFSVAEYYQNL